MSASPQEVTDHNSSIETKINDSFSHSAVQSISKFEEFASNLAEQYPNQNIKQIIQQMHDKKGMNYLHCACIYDCFEILPTLLDKYNIDINHIDNSGYPPIFYTVNNLDENCIKQLIKHKPNIDIKTIDSVIEAIGFPIYVCGGQSIFHIIAEQKGEHCLKSLFEYLLNEYKTKMINILMIKDNNGYTCIDIAIMLNRVNILNKLKIFVETHSNIKINNEIPKNEIRERMKREYELKIRQRVDRNNTKYEKINEHNDIFKNEQTNYAVFVCKTDEKDEEKQLFGMIREIKIFDQFDDEKYAKLAEKYNKKEGICGHITVCVVEYIINVLTKSNGGLIFNFNDNIFQNIIYKDLCNGIIINSIEKSIQFTLKWREKYIKNNKNEFNKKDTLKSQYLGLGCANFEISDYIQYEIKDLIASKIIFIRMNQIKHLNETEYELKKRILKDDKLFNSETFIIEFFAPRKLIKIDDFKNELQNRNIKAENMIYIFDLNGHFNCGFGIKIKNERNIVLIDTYTSNHVKNPTALKCFELVFDCVLNQNK